MLTTDNWWTDVFAATESATDTAALFAHIDLVCKQLEFRWFSYGIRIPVSFSDPMITVVASYPDGWIEHYEQSGYLAIDQTVQLGARSRQPILWNDGVFGARSDLWRDAQACGMRVGIAQSAWAPMGAFGLLSFARDSTPISEAELAALNPRVRWLADILHSAMQTFQAARVIGSREVTLSQREQEVLSWTADGKTSWEVSQILAISESTVNYHVNKIIAKLGVSSKSQAAVKAAALGLLGGTKSELPRTAARIEVISLGGKRRSER
jgi:LuxR family quorum-sensing system transcriptional regulator SolR